MKNVRFVKIDTRGRLYLARKYRIRGIPTIMRFKNGKNLDQLMEE
ncbi:thioredoxin domain-containing protein [Vibrio zhanjiangensis]|nr:thioredoxin domain-containing protein [Vibrio zhanjiangensis]